MRERAKQWWAALPLVCAAAWTLGCGQEAAKSGRRPPDASQATEAREFDIEGMTCEGCVSTVKSAIEAVPGVAAVTVSLPDKKAVVAADFSQASPQAIEDAVSKAGYKARPAAAPHDQPSRCA